MKNIHLLMLILLVCPHLALSKATYPRNKRKLSFSAKKVSKKQACHEWTKLAIVGAVIIASIGVSATILYNQDNSELQAGKNEIADSNASGNQEKISIDTTNNKVSNKPIQKELFEQPTPHETHREPLFIDIISKEKNFLYKVYTIRLFDKDRNQIGYCVFDNGNDIMSKDEEKQVALTIIRNHRNASRDELKSFLKKEKLDIRKKTGHIDYLRIDENYRGQGLSSFLLYEAFLKFQQIGVEKVYLNDSSNITKEGNFEHYTRYGFTLLKHFQELPGAEGKSYVISVKDFLQNRKNLERYQVNQVRCSYIEN